MERNAVASGDEALSSAFSQTLRRSLLTAGEERCLARLAARGDVAARDRLIESNTRLVVAIARGYRGRGVPHADLVQEGMIGLLQAVDRFDHARGPRLATYATWWIRSLMLQAIVAAPAIRLPAEAGRNLAAILRVEDELGGHGRPRPDCGTVADRTGMSPQRVERLRRAAHVVTSLDAEVAGGETTLVQLLADTASPEVATGIERDVAREALRGAVATLPARTRRVIELRYGLDGEEASTHDQIGEDLGLTAERCRQIEVEGLRRLRALAERASLAA
jgi:RNA polymerase sigma factor (sigma-70 family)